jgi:small subunit ribosomal protein S20
MANEKQGKDGKAKKVRRPSAQKRELQSIERNARNRSFKAKVNTAMRSLKDALTQKDAAGSKEKLAAVYGLMDKGVKKGVYKLNKAGRVKSRMHALVKQVSA